MLYCMVWECNRKYWELPAVKKNCFSDLLDILAITEELCSTIGKSKNIDLISVIKRSDEARLRCVKRALSAFILPIDREDMAYLALRLYRLNVCLADLCRYRAVYFPRTDVAFLIPPIEKTCELLRSSISEKGVSLPDLSSLPSFAPSDFDGYSPFLREALSQRRLYELTEDCKNKATDLLDQLIFTYIKNS